jgi:hypothetical protein
MPSYLFLYSPKGPIVAPMEDLLESSKGSEPRLGLTPFAEGQSHHGFRYDSHVLSR